MVVSLAVSASLGTERRAGNKRSNASASPIANLIDLEIGTIAQEKPYALEESRSNGIIGVFQARQEHPAGSVHYAQRVRETSVVVARIGEIRGRVLSDKAQPLEVGSIQNVAFDWR